MPANWVSRDDRGEGLAFGCIPLPAMSPTLSRSLTFAGAQFALANTTGCSDESMS